MQFWIHIISPIMASKRLPHCKCKTICLKRRDRDVWKCTYLVLKQKADCGNLGRVAGDVIASIEESIPVHSFKGSGRRPERVTEQAIGRLHKAGDARPGVKNDPAGARGIHRVQARRQGDHVLPNGDSRQANVVKRRQFRVLRQRCVLQPYGVRVAEEDVAISVRVSKPIR